MNTYLAIRSTCDMTGNTINKVLEEVKAISFKDALSKFNLSKREDFRYDGGSGFYLDSSWINVEVTQPES
jgi:hypothetical protein